MIELIVLLIPNLSGLCFCLICIVSHFMPQCTACLAQQCVCNAVANLFPSVCNVINTRFNRCNYFVPRCNFKWKKRFIVYQRSVHWNSLDKSTKFANTLSFNLKIWCVSLFWNHMSNNCFCTPCTFYYLTNLNFISVSP